MVVSPRRLSRFSRERLERAPRGETKIKEGRKKRHRGEEDGRKDGRKRGEEKKGKKGGGPCFSACAENADEFKARGARYPLICLSTDHLRWPTGMTIFVQSINYNILARVGGYQLGGLRCVEESRN